MRMFSLQCDLSVLGGHRVPDGPGSTPPLHHLRLRTAPEARTPSSTCALQSVRPGDNPNGKGQDIDLLIRSD